MNLVVTACDEAAGKERPYFPNAHNARSIVASPDPSVAAGTEEERLAVFRTRARFDCRSSQCLLMGIELPSVPT
jgi:hypothetical protein